jgi:hypothetical protein
VPCYNPLDGTITGSCSTSCDPGPKDPPVILAACCPAGGSNQGKCVPTSLVPNGMQQYLQPMTCPSGQLCAPLENLNSSFKPAQCEDDYLGITWYTGVCLSNCLNIPNASMLYQGSCDGIHTCVPCVDPTTGNPTGAPGC